MIEYRVEDRHVPGRPQVIPVRDYIPREPVGPALLWVHGGGFTGGGLDQKESDAPARALASSGRWVRTIDYRLVRAPRGRRGATDPAGLNRFPAAHDDVVDVARALHEASGGPIVIGGASAGANLSAGAALLLRDRGEAIVRGLVLAYGAFHAELPANAEIERELRSSPARLFFRRKALRRILVNYVGAESRLVPGYAFPGGADLRGMPPALVLDARNDRIRCSGHAFAAELHRAGVPVEEHVIEDWHAFLDRPGREAFRRGIDLVVAWLHEHDAVPGTSHAG